MAINSNKNVLTTGEVARICSVAPRTVSKWFDSGQLRGYRIPGSKDRRIPLDQLIQFMRANNMPLNGIDAGQSSVVVVDNDYAYAQTLSAALSDRYEFDVVIASTIMEAGGLVVQHRPGAVIIDVGLPDVVPSLIAQWIRHEAELRDTRLIGIGLGLGDARGQELLQYGFDAYLSKPFEVPSMAQLVKPHETAQV
ncbi:MAG: response regulator [Planctomycetota bacterium]|jgi:excisionase family DNA binding protein